MLFSLFQLEAWPTEESLVLLSWRLFAVALRKGINHLLRKGGPGRIRWRLRMVMVE